MLRSIRQRLTHSTLGGGSGVSNVLVSVPARQPPQADPVRAHGSKPDGITANPHVVAAHERHGDGVMVMDTIMTPMGLVNSI